MMNILLAIILGSLFGYALYKTGASNPKKLISMLRLEDLTLMKIILFAIGFSSIIIVVSKGLGIFNTGNFSIKSTNLGVITGGLIFGIGFGSVGTCPGTCVAAAGSINFKRALSAILGGLFGAFTFSMAFGWFDSLGLFRALDFGKLTLFKISEKYPSVFEAGFSGLLLSGLVLIGIASILPHSIIKSQKTKISDSIQSKG
jgi:uncharacterized protein